MLVAPVVPRTASAIVITTVLYLAISFTAPAEDLVGGGHKQGHGAVGSPIYVQQTAQRRVTVYDLQEDCAAHNISDETVIETSGNNTKTLPLGRGIDAMLTGQRRAGGEDGTWYEDKLVSLLIEFCEEEQREVHHRYVTSQNATAAKDEYGVCVEVLDGDQDAYATGLCERVANCYWEEPRENMERERRYTDAQYDTNEHAVRNYLRSIAWTYGTLGFTLAVSVLAGCARFSVKRGIHNKCVCDGDLQRDRTGYTDLEQKIPAAVYVVGLALFAVAGLLGLQGNHNVSLGFDLMSTTMDGVTDGIHEYTSSVSLPLGRFIDSLDASTGEVQLLLSTTNEWLGGLERGTLVRLDAFDSAHREHFVGRGPEFDALAEGVALSSADFVTEAVDDISALMNLLQVSFLGITDRMEGQGLNVLAALTVANETALKNHDRFDYFRRWFDDYAGARTTGMQGLVVIVGGAGVVGLLGVAAGLVNCKPCLPCVNLLRFTIIVTFTSTWVAFILSSMVIVGAVAWSDGCHFLDIAATKGWEAVGSDGLSALVFDGCLRGSSVSEEFNLTDALVFFESYPEVAEEVGALNITSAEKDFETAVYAISDFVDSLNATAVAVSNLSSYTNVQVNGSLLQAPHCTYNVTFEGEEATAYLGRPWLALPTVSTAAADVREGGANGSSSSLDSINQTTLSAQLTPWEAGGSHQSFGRQGDESASTYMSRVFNSSNCSSINADLLSAWDLAARERAYRDQMQDDLTCTETATTSGGDCANGGYNDSSSSSVSISSTFSLSPCSCTSDNYNAGASDTLLANFRAFANNVTALRHDLAGLLTLPSATAGGRGALANASLDSWQARCASRCSFIASQYKNFEDAMCGVALSGLAQMGFAMFFMAIAALVLAITSSIMVHRLKAAWSRSMSKILSTEENIVMEEYSS